MWANPPTFLAPAVGMATYGTAFGAAMLAANPLGWAFLLVFVVHTWRMLMRLNQYIEGRVRLAAARAPQEGRRAV